MRSFLLTVVLHPQGIERTHLDSAFPNPHRAHQRMSQEHGEGLIFPLGLNT